MSLVLPGMPAAGAVPVESKAVVLDRVEVPGTRVSSPTRTHIQARSFKRGQIEASGANSLGELHQGLSLSGAAANARLNTSGNLGPPLTAAVSARARCNSIFCTPAPTARRFSSMGVAGARNPPARVSETQSI